MPGQFRAGGGSAGLIRTRRFRGHAAGLTAMLILLFIGTVFIIVSFAVRSSAARSSFVQAHGLPREAVILSVHNTAHTSTTTTGTGSWPSGGPRRRRHHGRRAHRAFLAPGQPPRVRAALARSSA